MEITRKLHLDTSSLPGSPLVIIIDINNSTLNNKVYELLHNVDSINNPKDKQQQQHQVATKLVVTATQEVLIEVLDELQHTLPSQGLNGKIFINLNLYQPQFSISYWDTLITQMALPSVIKLYTGMTVNLVNKISAYVTFQSSVDRQLYVDSVSSSLRQFRERVDVELNGGQKVEFLDDDDDDDKREFLTKSVLLNLIRRKGLNDDEIGELLMRTSCVAEVLDELYPI